MSVNFGLVSADLPFQNHDDCFGQIERQQQKDVKTVETGDETLVSTINNDLPQTSKEDRKRIFVNMSMCYKRINLLRNLIQKPVTRER
jgi:hypothetical protein